MQLAKGTTLNDYSVNKGGNLQLKDSQSDEDYFKELNKEPSTSHYSNETSDVGTEKHKDNMQSIRKYINTPSRVKRYKPILNKIVDAGIGLKKPGSIWLPLGILIILFFVLVQVNGKSRIAWLYYVIIGEASLSGSSSNVGTTSTAFV